MSIINIDRVKCVHCGACTAVCAPAALRLSGPEATLVFDEECCEDCGSCLKACPLRAITLNTSVRWLYA
ncbi:MAG TPA: 4Fe-4S binding protein [Firmicutes bacterium]|jgi:ferredoxin|nr:4Fe-4S binding protein [Bacillota bacterium]